MFSLHGTCKPDPCSLAHWGLEKKLHFTLFPECAAVTPVLRGGFCGQGLSSWWQARVVLPVTKFRWQRERTMSLLSLSVCQLVKPNESATCHSWCHLCQLSAQILIDLFWISQQPQGRGHRWNVHPIVGGRCLVFSKQEASVWKMAGPFKQELYPFSWWWCCSILYGLVNSTIIPWQVESKDRLRHFDLVLIECIYEQLLHL